MNEVLSEVEVANLLNCAVTTIGECARDKHLPLGMDCDRAAWEAVRAAWQKEDAQAALAE